MIPAPFAYHRPRSVDEAIALLGQHCEEARVVAGGQSLIPMMKLRLARRAHLLDLQDLDELRFTTTTSNRMSTASALRACPKCQGRWPNSPSPLTTMSHRE